MRLNDLLVNIDGPYGKPMIDPHNYEVVILVSGGVGVTPMHSMLMHLYNRYMEEKQDYLDDTSLVCRSPNCANIILQDSASGRVRLRKLYFIWCARKPVMLSMFQQSFKQILSNNEEDIFELTLCLTSGSKVQEMSNEAKINLPITLGRLDFDAKFASIAKKRSQSTRKLT
jgi:hypothetical protein